MYFNPRAPCGARPAANYRSHQNTAHFNPRAPCGARRYCHPWAQQEDLISIHAPRAGRDASSIACLTIHKDFNPRAPCGARHYVTGVKRGFQNFNPRAPCGARLFTSKSFPISGGFQSTRPVRGATISRSMPAAVASISIHAPRAGRDLVRYYGPDYDNLFQSTRPVRGATIVSESDTKGE